MSNEIGQFFITSEGKVVTLQRALSTLAPCRGCCFSYYSKRSSLSSCSLHNQGLPRETTCTTRTNYSSKFLIFVGVDYE